MIMISKISEHKDAQFSEYDFYFKKNIHIIFLYLPKYPFNNFKMKAKLELLVCKIQLAMITWTVRKEGT